MLLLNRSRKKKQKQKATTAINVAEATTFCDEISKAFKYIYFEDT